MKKILLYLVTAFLLVSCDSDNNTVAVDNFDRKAMLTNWADNIIIPAYANYATEVGTLKTSVDAFAGDPSKEKLSSLRSNWLNAYLAWQSVAMFEIGKAEELTIRNFTNIYPTSAEDIEANILSGDYNLSLPSKNDEQGFPALDYLINGLGSTDELIVDKYIESEGHRTYIIDLLTRLNDMANAVNADWKSGGYRTEFIENNGSNASASVNRLINDYLFYYEKFLRAGKIGIPAGIFSSSEDATKVEAYYKEDVSKQLFNQSLNAVQDFFNGKYFASGVQGPSIKSYLDELASTKDSKTLSDAINQQFDAARSTGSNLNDSFALQISNDKTLLLNTYDELQGVVILLKVDMLAALNIKVDYVDADGD